MGRGWRNTLDPIIRIYSLYSIAVMSVRAIEIAATKSQNPPTRISMLHESAEADLVQSLQRIHSPVFDLDQPLRRRRFGRLRRVLAVHFVVRDKRHAEIR